MSWSQNVVVGVSLRPEHLEILEKMQEVPILRDAQEVTLLHVINKKSLSYLPANLGLHHDTQEVSRHCREQLESLKSRAKLESARAKIRLECIFGKDPLLSLLHYLKENQAGLFIGVAAGSYGVEGFFHHSLAARLVEEAPCNIYIMRPQKQIAHTNVEVLRKRDPNDSRELDLWSLA